MSAAKKQRELNRAKEEHDKSRLRAGFAKSRKEMVSMVDTVLAQKVETLEQQLAIMTEDRDRLLSVMCEIAGSKSLTATPTQFYQHLQRIASDATITPPHDEALQAFAAKVREQAIAACAEVRVIVDGNHQWTALHVQDQCIEAIRHLKELPK